MHNMNVCTRSIIRANTVTYSQRLVHISTQEEEWKEISLGLSRDSFWMV